MFHVSTNSTEVRSNWDGESDENESGSAPTESARASTRLIAEAILRSSISNDVSLQHSGGPILSGSVSMTVGPEYRDHPATSLDTVQIGYALPPYLAIFPRILYVVLMEVR